MNHYETLGVPPTATQIQIKQAYRKLAQKTHPDKSDMGDFKAVQGAYKILKDPQSRAEYDKQGMLNPEYKAAIKKLQNTAIQVIVNSEYDVDIILQLTINVNTYISGLRAEQEKSVLEGQKFKRVKRKLKTKSTFSRNIFIEKIEATQEQIEKHIKTITDKISMAEKMLEILDFYEYECLQFFPRYEARII